MTDPNKPEINVNAGVQMDPKGLSQLEAMLRTIVEANSKARTLAAYMEELSKDLIGLDKGAGAISLLTTEIEKLNLALKQNKTVRTMVGRLGETSAINNPARLATLGELQGSSAELRAVREISRLKQEQFLHDLQQGKASAVSRLKSLKEEKEILQAISALQEKINASQAMGYKAQKAQDTLTIAQARLAELPKDQTKALRAQMTIGQEMANAANQVGQINQLNTLARLAKQKLSTLTSDEVAKRMPGISLQQLSALESAQKHRYMAGMGGADTDEGFRRQMEDAKKALDILRGVKDQLRREARENDPARQARLQRDRDLLVNERRDQSTASAMGRYRFTQLTSADLSQYSNEELPLFARRLRRGQESRLDAAIGRNAQKEIDDALHALDILDARMKKIREEAKLRTAAPDTPESDIQAAARRIKLHQDTLRAKHEEAVKQGQINNMTDLTAKNARREYIELLASTRVTEHQILLMTQMHQVSDQLAASKLRAARGTMQEREEEERIQDLLRQRSREINRLNRQSTESPEERARIYAQQRRNTAERLFGDGGASLMATQARFLINYQTMNLIQGLMAKAMQAAVMFDNALKSLQAISAATNLEMVKMKGSLEAVAAASRYSATEVADAAVLLAQAGLSVSQIQDTMKAVVQLATASGSDLKKTVDVVTSVLSVFDFTASKSGEIANKLTTALNMSKLDIDKMSLGLQYAGNAAADAGVSFDELVASLSAVANAGIRSGSTLGTGLRQLFIELTQPTAKFQKEMDKLGLTLADIDIKGQGFEGVMKNLADKGFTAGEAFGAFQIRSASAFAALTNNMAVFDSLRESMDGSTAAADANAIQMESLQSSYNKMATNLGLVAAEGLRPVTALLKQLTGSASSSLEAMGRGGEAAKIAFTGLTAALTAITIAIGGRMIAGFSKMTEGIKGMFLWTNLQTKSTQDLAKAEALLNEVESRNAEISVIRNKLREQDLALSAAEKAMAEQKIRVMTAEVAAMEVTARRLAAPIGLFSRFMAWTPIVMGIGMFASAFSALGDEEEKMGLSAETASQKLDLLKTQLNSVRQANDTTRQTLENLDKAILSASQRIGRLSTHQDELRSFTADLASQFRDQGLTIDNLSNKSVPELIQQLEALRVQMSKEYIAQVRVESDLLKEKNFAQASGLRGSAKVSYRRAVDMGPTTFGKTNSMVAATGAVLEAGVNTSNLRLPGFKDTGDLYAQIVSQLAKLQRNDADINILRPQIERLKFLKEALDKANAANALARQAMTEGSRGDTTALAATGIQAARLSPTSGFQVSAKVEQELSQWNQNRPGSIGDQEKFLKGRRDLLRGEIDTKSKALKQLADARSPQRIAQRETLNAEISELAQTLSRVDAQYQPVHKKFLEEEKLRTEGEINRITAEIKRLQAEQQNSSDPGTIKAKEKAMISRQRALRGLKARIVEIERLKSAEGDARTASPADAAAEEDAARITSESNALVERARQRIEEQTRAIDAALGRDETSRIENDAKAQTRLQHNQDLRRQAAERALKHPDAISRFGNIGTSGYPVVGQSDATELGFRQQLMNRWAVAASKKQDEAAQARLIQQQLAETSKGMQTWADIVSRMEAAQEETRRKLDLAKEAMDKAVRERDAKLKDGRDFTQSESKALDDKIKAWKDLQALDVEQTNKLDDYNSRLTGLLDTRERLLEELGKTSGPFNTIFDAMKVGIEGLTQSFSEMFQRIITSTGDTKAAFEEMARSILGSMLKVLTDKAAEKFMNMLLDLGMNVFSGSSKKVFTGDYGVGGNQNSRMAMTGGPIRRAVGGPVPGLSLGRDSVPAWLEPGEYVMNRKAVSALGMGAMDFLNGQTEATMRQAQAPGSVQRPSGQQPSLVNVWVVTPDQKSGIGKDDIVVTVSDNISRGGSLRQLIKQVQVGG